MLKIGVKCNKNKCKKINTNVFLKLESDGYILIKDRKSDNIYYELL